MRTSPASFAPSVPTTDSLLPATIKAAHHNYYIRTYMTNANDCPMATTPIFLTFHHRFLNDQPVRCATAKVIDWYVLVTVEASMMVAATIARLLCGQAACAGSMCC
jgi:hypothetical protein